MSYYDQYNTAEERATYPPPQQYTDQAEAAYDPYDNNQPHRSYDQGGYGYQEQNYGGYKDEPEPSPSGAAMKEVDTSAFDNDAFASSRTRMVEPKCVVCFYSCHGLEHVSTPCLSAQNFEGDETVAPRAPREPLDRRQPRALLWPFLLLHDHAVLVLPRQCCAVITPGKPIYFSRVLVIQVDLTC